MSGDLQSLLEVVKFFLCAPFWIRCVRLKSPSWALFSFPSCFLFIRLVAPGERPCALHSSHSQPPDAVSKAQPGEPGGLHCVCPKWPSWEDSSACPEKRGLGTPLAFDPPSSLPLMVSETSRICLLSSHWRLCLVRSMGLISAPAPHPACFSAPSQWGALFPSSGPSQPVLSNST